MRPIPLRDARDEACFGAKAVQLGEALRGGLTVPAGFALSVEMVDAIATGTPAPPDLAATLFSTLGPSLAVRSSAVGEDSAAASFAGLHATVLNIVSAPELFHAIGRVRQSGEDEAALAYRQRRNIAGAPRVAVVVQTMVHADCSGVMFTRNPISGRDERLIEASWGLGESVVGGLVTPDLFRLDRDGAVLERRAGKKDRQIAFEPAGGTHEIPVELARQHVLCLETISLNRLHELACSCERVWSDGSAQDLEWAFAGANLYLLQRRAVTTRSP
jgi:pyruvate, water dikinase